MPHPDIALNEMILRRSTPVIINSFNQLTYLKNIITKLCAEGFRNIYVLDQASSYPPLQEWLAGVQERGQALPLFSSINKGPHDFFLSKTYDMFGGAPFIYSDPDLSWNQLAPEFLTRLFELAHRHHIFKVGPALKIPDKNQIKPNLKCIQDGSVGMGIAEYEARYWITEVEPRVYNSPIDTTMHLFLPQYYKHGAPLITGLRVSGEGYDMLHQPWFINDPMPNDEYDFYLKLTKHTTWRPAEEIQKAQGAN